MVSFGAFWVVSCCSSVTCFTHKNYGERHRIIPFYYIFFRFK